MGRLVVIGANARRRQAAAGVASILSPSRSTRARRPPAGQKKFVPESVPYPYLYAKMHRTARNGEQRAD
ncbi:hypothetical protein WL99_02765 [Burkholderia cepacia]|nr:hypothetical protein WI67_15600 [Burkholderia cepacia]KML36259.1 hypothetical protein VL13_28965 [Burkholderia lata]KMN52132.1 hypothetical protein VK92_34165 [Burkholderia sp. LK4]KAB1585546.1 hypothetical protein C5O75_032725 [Burkholderia cepacia]KML02304.1 hypothetical protein VL00_31715 [Burkholderia cepacia]